MYDPIETRRKIKLQQGFLCKHIHWFNILNILGRFQVHQKTTKENYHNGVCTKHTNISTWLGMKVESCYLKKLLNTKQTTSKLIDVARKKWKLQIKMKK